LNNIHDILAMDSSFVAIKNKGKLRANKVKGSLRLNIIVCGALQDFKVLPTTYLPIDLPTEYLVGWTYIPTRYKPTYLSIYLPSL
jgi:hypothetical protein